MKAFLLTSVLLLSSTSIAAQKLPEWYRVYTFDESFIEMNTANVVLGGDIGRVTFRWRFDQPETFRGDPKLTYKTRLETIEFKCADKQYRYYEVSLLDSAGKTIHSELMRPPYTWHEMIGNVMSTMSGPACRLIAERTAPEKITGTVDELTEQDKVAEFALSIKQTLERVRDFKPVIDKFFTSDFVERYKNDRDTNWFYNLNRDTVAKASHAELQKFYVASLNAGYLTSLYVISQSPSDDDSPEEGSIQQEKILPPDVYQLINRHPYTLAYKANEKNYEYLAENIDSVERMRSYTDLLEKIAAAMRRHLAKVRVGHSDQNRMMAEEDSDEEEFDIGMTVHASDYLGLPKGTKVFSLTLPLLRLQMVAIKGALKIISVTDSAH